MRTHSHIRRLPCTSHTNTHAFSVSHIPHRCTETLIYSSRRYPGSPTLRPADHPNHTGCYMLVCFHSHICNYCTLPPLPRTHTSISLHIRPPQAGYRNQTQPLCVGCWPGFLRAVPEGQGGGPGWRWVCTPSWLTHLSHREWLARGDPEFSVGTGASPRAPWSHPARPWREGTGPGLEGG